MEKILPGTKFFRYDYDEPIEIVRTTKIDDNKIKFIDDSGHRTSMPKDKFLSKYRMLSVDGMIALTLCKVDGNTDVIVSLSNIRTHQPPQVDVVCRQMIYDFFTNNMKKTDRVNYVGVSVSRDTCPSNVQFESVLACDKLIENRYISVYLDDTLDDIMSLFNHAKFDTALRTLANNPPYADGKITYGFNKSIRELLENNNFMYDFRKLFGIKEVPSHIDPESEGLSLPNILALEDDLHENIMETYVVPYSRDIDTSKFHRRWLLASSIEDKHDKVYIVGYDVSDNEYVKRTL